MRQLLYLSALIVTFISCENSQAQTAKKLPEIVTSRSEFSIPFRFDQQELTRLNARKVHLFLSQNRGQTWKQAQTASLNQNQFIYKPETDGEYWFSVAISDEDGVMHPEPALNSPGLKVSVDRTKPDLNLSVKLSPGRQLELSWRVLDAHPDVSTLELEFRNTPDDKWNRVYVKKQLAGKTAWRIRADQYPEIRGRFADAAGNFTEEIVKLENLSEKNQRPALVAGLYDSPANSGPASLAKINSIEISSGTAGPVMQPQLSVPAQLNNVTQLNDVAQPEVEQVQNRLQSNQRPAVSQSYQSSYNDLGSVRYMTTHQFEIEYQVAGVGPSGIGIVELFITQDNGARWWRYGIDQDLKSPMVVETPEDGRYGFHFRIHSGVGNSERPPQPGQKPQIDLIVDSKKPNIEFLKSKQGHGDQINHVTVQWNYYDDYPAEKPISLYYASNLNGPWELVEGGLKNTGSHSFTLPRNAPPKLHLKLSARDAAGNTSEAISNKTLMIDLARPTARIITVDPIR